MKKRPKIEPAEPQNINMIPMIDVILNLLIFLMLTNEISAVKSDDLPRVSEAKPDEGEPGRQMFTIDKLGNIKVGPQIITRKEVDQLLRAASEIYRKKGSDASEKPILVRADKEVPFGVIQDFMVLCVKNRIYKLSFGARLNLEESMTNVKEIR